MPQFQSEGLDLFYIDAAPTTSDRGEPIALIHGFASTHAVNWVNTQWVQTLNRNGRRVIAIDNRGHGGSDKPHDVGAYNTARMASDMRNLLDHLSIGRADIMGYSMGARITAALAYSDPARVRSAILGGLGLHLVDGGGLPQSIADAMEAPGLGSIADPMGRLFRRFAEANGSDLEALAACIRGSRQNMTAEVVGAIEVPVLVAVGTADPIAGDAHALAALLPRGRAVDIPGRDHNLAVGDKVFKAAVLAFLAERP